MWYTVEATPSLLRYVVEKGSITMDGVSLTVARVEADRFSVSLIPHTAAVTVLGRKRPGDVVNLETDVVGKYVEKLLLPPARDRNGPACRRHHPGLFSPKWILRRNRHVSVQHH